jgi:hypothetical protein
MNAEIFSQARHVTMITLGNCLRKNSLFKIDRLLRLLKKVACKTIRPKIQTIIKDKTNWMNESGWYLSIIKTLALDDTELNHILGLKSI